MIKQTITYKDFNEVERTEDFWFHLDKADLLKFHAMRKGGMKAYMEDIVRADDSEKILEIFDMFILKSIGKRSEDGRRFIRNDDIREEFTQTNAYAEFLYQLAGNADEGAKFINGIMPAGLEEELKNYTPQGGTVELPADTSTNDAEAKENPAVTAEVPVEIKWTDFTKQQLLEMPAASWEQLVGGMKPKDMPHELLLTAMERKTAGK